MYDAIASGRLFSYNLRFPGQYFDAERGKHYNYFRDYDSTIGRYLESDPIGMNARSTDTYSYTSQRPLGFLDRYGLCKVEVRCNLLSAGKVMGTSPSHCFVVTTDPNGNETYFRGGPTSGGGNMSRASGNSASGGGDSGFGAIRTDSGAHQPNSVDWPTPSTPETGRATYRDDKKPCTCVDTNLLKTLTAISNANTPYNPLSENSNSVAAAAIRGLGYSPGNAPAFAPGWDYPLPGTSQGGQSCCVQ
jgi:RHS repeat-associated protein